MVCGDDDHHTGRPAAGKIYDSIQSNCSWVGLLQGTGIVTPDVFVVRNLGCNCTNK